MVVRATAASMGAFLDAFQKVADLANNSHGQYSAVLPLSVILDVWSGCRMQLLVSLAGMGLCYAWFCLFFVAGRLSSLGSVTFTLPPL